MPDMQITPEEARLLSDGIREKLASDDFNDIKEAEASLTDYTRRGVREKSYLDNIYPAEPLDLRDCDRQIHTDKFIKVIDMEPDSPAALSMPLSTNTPSMVLRGQRYGIMIDRQSTRRMVKDVDELKSYDMDIRRVISDNQIMDLLADKDSRFISMVNTAVVGENLTVPATASKQYTTTTGGITRTNLAIAAETLPAAQRGSVGGFSAHRYLMNNITAIRLIRLDPRTAGDQLAQDTLLHGWTSDELMGVKTVTTTKKTQVTTGTMYMFAAPEGAGKHYVVREPTMHAKRKDFYVEFYVTCMYGFTLGNIAAVARHTFKD